MTNLYKEKINNLDLNILYDSITPVESIDLILSHACRLHASDIHCDPSRSGIDIRFRIDGKMEGVGVLPHRLHEEFISRLKILSGARTDIHAIPQDGRWQTDIGGDTYNLRISFMPAYHGENAVIRLLPVNIGSHRSFSSLGFTPDHVVSIYKSLQHTNGIILVTGPTGSGKTTTLHTCLSEKAREPLSIITLEDPIEYEIQNVRQIHVRHSHGVTFASGLRSALRQDPDVIMVGEIRDNETARVAIHTALTGHLVLSTLHTNGAIETIPRLIDMGVDHYLLASTLRLIVAQRLVRVACRDCLAVGCSSCRDTGYIGRSVIAEVCEIGSRLRNIIAERGSLSEIEACAMSEGFRPISEDGAEKVDWGVTTKEEVMRVLYE